MALTLIVEPDPGGHRFQSVAMVAARAARTDQVLLLTSVGATTNDEFRAYLSDSPIKAQEVYDHIYPPTAQMVKAIAEVCRAEDVSRVVVMDADQSLKRWWYVAPRAFRGLPRRPRVIFFLTRYPAQLAWHDRVGWRLRFPKAVLAIAGMSTRSVHRVVGYAGRDDMSPGWLVKRVRDPAICSAHSRDRDQLRVALDLPAGRRLVGICGVVTERKYAPLVLEAIRSVDDSTCLLLAGTVAPEVLRWCGELPEDQRDRVIVRNEFLSNEALDGYVAAVDAVALAMTNNGPSGIMGKALAAGVPVVTAGSMVRAREVAATDNGAATELTAGSFAAGLRRVFARDWSRGRSGRVPMATPESYAADVLGS